jgi:large subunit ribosomal protein L21
MAKSGLIFILMTETYAIVETGGKQYKVSPGQKVNVEYLCAGIGKEVELSKVLFISDGGEGIVGNPVIENARVTATCLKEERSEKVIVFKYKAKTRYNKKNGHRQLLSTLEFKDIIKPGGTVKHSKKQAEAGGKD